MKLTKIIISFFFYCFCCIVAYGQIVVVPAGQKPLPKVNSQKKNDTKITLPFIDDFSDYEGNPNNNLWQEAGGVFINPNYGVFSKTLGVATLDALDNQGVLYSEANITSFNADTLTSLSIRLDSVFSPYARKLSVGDSVYLSFFVQPGGGLGQMWERLGIAPSKNDSIVLEFYDSNSDIWQRVWSMKGLLLDSLYAADSDYFRYVLVPIADEKYFNDNFKFRFRNFASLYQSSNDVFMGNCDQWNIDYVYLNLNRTITDSTRADLAFVSKSPSLLKRYQAMPSRQFRREEIADSLIMKMINLGSMTSNSDYKFYIFDSVAAGQQIYYDDRGFENLTPFIQTQQYRVSPVFLLSVADTLATRVNNAQWYSFNVVHTIKPGVGQDAQSENDTAKFVQRFENYFAYDDGSAEAGIGVATDHPNSQFALAFSLNEEDTLTAVDIYFNSTYHNATQKPFYICVFNSEGNYPKDLLYSSQQLIVPVPDGLNRFQRYVLDTALVVSGKIFVSVQSKTGTFLNIGFDQNNDASNYTFGYVNNQWEQSFVKGAPMIRAYFGYKSTVDLETAVQKPDLFRIYPKPTSQYINIESADNSKVIKTIDIFNILGNKIYSSHFVERIDVSGFSNGIYLLKITDTEGQVHQHKVIVNHFR
jgi:hypothetical protein